MLFLLDANVLIDANRDYYPIARIPEFWEWLVYHGEEGNVGIPLEVYGEFKDATGDLGEWARSQTVKAALLLNEEADASLVSRVIDEGYAVDLTDDEVENLGRDPFLIAYALPLLGDRCVVTTERSKRKGQNPESNVQTVIYRTSAAISGYRAMTRFGSFASSISRQGGDLNVETSIMWRPE